MNIRNMAASLALAAGSLLFVAQPALHAQDYSYNGYHRPVTTRRAIQHDRHELNSDLARGNYRAAHREIREIRLRRARLARARWARTHRYYNRRTGRYYYR
jgi:hypothetical protein